MAASAKSQICHHFVCFSGFRVPTLVGTLPMLNRERLTLEGLESGWHRITFLVVRSRLRASFAESPSSHAPFDLLSCNLQASTEGRTDNPHQNIDPQHIGSDEPAALSPTLDFAKMLTAALVILHHPTENLICLDATKSLVQV